LPALAAASTPGERNPGRGQEAPLRDDFTPESDVDVLLSFAPGTVYKFKDLAAMEVELSTIFGRRVDVVDKDAVHASPNYLRRRAILSSAEVIYAA
jgi:predicted nucleotidyltransferase